jgi:hypothetical protein
VVSLPPGAALQKYADLYGEDAPHSRRIDIPKEMLAPAMCMQAGRRYLHVSDPKYADMTPLFKAIKEFMKAKDGK